MTTERLHAPQVGPRRTGALAARHRHPDASRSPGIGSERRIDGLLVEPHPSGHQGQVTLLHLASPKRLIQTLSRLLHTTFMIISHELRSIFAIADRLLLLDAARKTQVGLGPPDELRDHCDDQWVRNFLTGGAAA